jgi:hypothetical protein
MRRKQSSPKFSLKLPKLPSVSFKRIFKKQPQMVEQSKTDTVEYIDDRTLIEKRFEKMGHLIDPEEKKDKTKPKLIQLTKVQIATYGFIVLTATAIAGSVIALQQIFRIRNIEVSSLKPVQLIGLQSFRGDSLLFTSQTQIKGEVLSANAEVKDVLVTKKYPNTINIHVSLYEPLAYLQTNGGLVLLSDDGHILSKARVKTLDLPVISYYQQLSYEMLQSGENIDFLDIIKGLHFLQKSLDLGFKITSIDINGYNMLGLYAGDKEILFTLEKDSDLQDYQLETITRQLKIQGKDFKKIDLRFDKPVVEFSNKS